MTVFSRAEALTAQTTPRQGMGSGTTSRAREIGSSHRCRPTDQQVPDPLINLLGRLVPSGEIELRGGPVTELGGSVAEGNVFLDGKPVGSNIFLTHYIFAWVMRHILLVCNFHIGFEAFLFLSQSSCAGMRRQLGRAGRKSNVQVKTHFPQCSFDSLIFTLILHRMLNYNTAIPHVGSKYGHVQGKKRFALNDVNCKGDEKSLLECPHTQR